MADLVPYHDRDGFIWFDGKLVPWREANLHVLNKELERRVSEEIVERMKSFLLPQLITPVSEAFSYRMLYVITLSVVTGWA